MVKSGILTGMIFSCGAAADGCVTGMRADWAGGGLSPTYGIFIPSLFTPTLIPIFRLR